MSMIRVRACLVVAVCMVAAHAALAAVPSTEALLRPVEVEDVQISPSGKRIAFMRRGVKSERDFTVVERRAEGLVPIFVTQLPGNQSFKSYQWLAEDHLALSFSNSEETLLQLSIADIPARKVTVLEPAAAIIKPRWGDDDHVLISTSIGCSLAESVRGRCLASFNLRNGGRTIVASAVRLLPIAFFVVSETEIYARGTDERRQQHAMRFDMESLSWSEISLPQMARIADVQRDKQTALTPGAARIPADSRLVGPRDKPPVGYISPPPGRGFTSLAADFDSLEIALETRFAGRHTMLVQVSDDLNTGLVVSSSRDEPQQYYLWDRARGLLPFDDFASRLAGQTLARSRIESRWLPGVNLVVTEPPSGTPVNAVVVMPVSMAERFAAIEIDAFDGRAQAFALHGVAHVLMPVTMPEEFADGAAATAWRQRVHGDLQTVINAARELQGSLPVCIHAGGYLAATLLTGPGYEHVACISAGNAPLLPARLSERIDLGGNAYMKLSNATLEREVRGAFAQADGSLIDPSGKVQSLPARILLSYEMTVPLYQVFSRHSSAFRSAAGKAGKQVQHLAPLNDRDDESAYYARLLDASIDFVRSAAGAAPVGVAR